MEILTFLCVILPVENHCRPTNPCEHDGLCVEMDDGYKCRCKVGYKGVNCEGKFLFKPSDCIFSSQSFCFIFITKLLQFSGIHAHELLQRDASPDSLCLFTTHLQALIRTLVNSYFRIENDFNINFRI